MAAPILRQFRAPSAEFPVAMFIQARNSSAACLATKIEVGTPLFDSRDMQGGAAAAPRVSARPLSDKSAQKGGIRECDRSGRPCQDKADVIGGIEIAELTVANFPFLV